MIGNCSVCGSSHDVRNVEGKQILCGRHRHQLRVNKTILPRTKYDPNEIIDKGNYYEMILYNYKNEKVASTIFDKSDLDIISKHHWFKNCGVYAAATINRKTVFLHGLLMGRTGSHSIVIDHINQKLLDNRRLNLRIVPSNINVINSQKHKGITWNKFHKKWGAYVRCDYGKYFYFEYFKTKEEALLARAEAVKRFYTFHGVDFVEPTEVNRVNII